MGPGFRRECGAYCKGREQCHCHDKRSMRRPRNTCATNTRSSGSGETTYTRGSNKTTRALGTWAVRNAILDAGLKPTDIDGMLDYSGGDSTSATFISGDLGMRLNFYMDVVGGGSSTEALVGIAIGIIEAGMCKMRRDLPLDERLQPSADRRHRRALGGARRRRHAAQPRLWLAERRAELRPDLHAPHVRLRHQARAGRDGQGGAQPPCLEQSRRPITKSASRSRTCCRAASSASRCICWIAASRPTTRRRSS